MKKKILIIISFIILVIIGIIISLTNNKQVIIEEEDKPSYITTTKIICQIKGEVTRPGVYSLSSGARLQDLVIVAGGFTSYADTNNVNLVTILEDSSCYTIEKINKLDNANQTNNLININTASLEQLMKLSGIGASKAQAIIDYRSKNGNFQTINDLTKVNGISEKILNQIMDLICVK